MAQTFRVNGKQVGIEDLTDEQLAGFRKADPTGSILGFYNRPDRPASPDLTDSILAAMRSAERRRTTATGRSNSWALGSSFRHGGMFPISNNTSSLLGGG